MTTNRIAVYDACVLFSPSLRDLLLYLAAHDFVSPRWSETIHEEWIRAILKNRPGETREKLNRTRRAMDAAFPNALVTGYESLAASLDLPDDNDRHVLAVAIIADASMIVTSNLKDFPQDCLRPHKIEALSPDDFFIRMRADDPNGILQSIKKHRTNLKRPPKSVHDFLATLEKQGLTKTVTFLREHQTEI